MMKRTCKSIAFLTALFFLVNQVSPVGLALTAPSPTEVKIPSHFQLDLPPEFGTIASLISGSGPTVVHVQTAHGNYEAQKNIQSILRYLNKNYGFKVLFLEGSAVKLDAARLHFVSGSMDLSQKVAEDLAQDAMLTGAELFMLENEKVEGFGIENFDPYMKNGKTFLEVLQAREKSQNYLKKLDLQIERLASPFLSPTLRAFLKHFDRYEMQQLPLTDWLSYLKTSAEKHLSIDLSDAAYQLEWPMLIRLFKLQKFEAKMDVEELNKEKAAFLPYLKKALDPKSRNEIYPKVEQLLLLQVSHHELPDPETGLLFENMVRALPKDFQYEKYPQISLLIGHLILQSELKADLLMSEVESLINKITEALSENEQTKQILGLLKDYSLLKKLYALELTPDDFEKLLNRESEIRPDQILKRFSEVDHDKRVKNGTFTYSNEATELFEKAVDFYRGAKERDGYLIENVQKRLRELDQTKAVVVTGGFHSTPFKEHFKKAGFNYALISPKISSADGRNAYIQSAFQKGLNFLEKSTWEAPLLVDPTYVIPTALQKMIDRHVRLRVDEAKSFYLNKGLTELTSKNDQRLMQSSVIVPTMRSETRMVDLFPELEDEIWEIYGFFRYWGISKHLRRELGRFVEVMEIDWLSLDYNVRSFMWKSIMWRKLSVEEVKEYITTSVDLLLEDGYEWKFLTRIIERAKTLEMLKEYHEILRQEKSKLMKAVYPEVFKKIITPQEFRAKTNLLKDSFTRVERNLFSKGFSQAGVNQVLISLLQEVDDLETLPSILESHTYLLNAESVDSEKDTDARAVEVFSKYSLDVNEFLLLVQTLAQPFARFYKLTLYARVEDEARRFLEELSVVNISNTEFLGVVKIVVDEFSDIVTELVANDNDRLPAFYLGPVVRFALVPLIEMSLQTGNFNAIKFEKYLRGFIDVYLDFLLRLTRKHELTSWMGDAIDQQAIGQLIDIVLIKDLDYEIFVQPPKTVTVTETHERSPSPFLGGYPDGFTYTTSREEAFPGRVWIEPIKSPESESKSETRARQIDIDTITEIGTFKHRELVWSLFSQAKAKADQVNASGAIKAKLPISAIVWNPTNEWVPVTKLRGNRDQVLGGFNQALESLFEGLNVFDDQEIFVQLAKYSEGTAANGNKINPGLAVILTPLSLRSETRNVVLSKQLKDAVWANYGWNFVRDGFFALFWKPWVYLGVKKFIQKELQRFVDSLESSGVYNHLSEINSKVNNHIQPHDLPEILGKGLPVDELKKYVTTLVDESLKDDKKNEGLISDEIRLSIVKKSNTIQDIVLYYQIVDVTKPGLMRSILPALIEKTADHKELKQKMLLLEKPFEAFTNGVAEQVPGIRLWLSLPEMIRKSESLEGLPSKLEASTVQVNEYWESAEIADIVLSIEAIEYFELAMTNVPEAEHLLLTVLNLQLSHQEIAAILNDLSALIPKLASVSTVDDLVMLPAQMKLFSSNTLRYAFPALINFTSQRERAVVAADVQRVPVSELFLDATTRFLEIFQDFTSRVKKEGKLDLWLKLANGEHGENIIKQLIWGFLPEESNGVYRIEGEDTRHPAFIRIVFDDGAAPDNPRSETRGETKLSRAKDLARRVLILTDHDPKAFVREAGYTPLKLNRERKLERLQTVEEVIAFVNAAVGLHIYLHPGRLNFNERRFIFKFLLDVFDVRGQARTRAENEFLSMDNSQNHNFRAAINSFIKEQFPVAVLSKTKQDKPIGLIRAFLTTALVVPRGEWSEWLSSLLDSFEGTDPSRRKKIIADILLKSGNDYPSFVEQYLQLTMRLREERDARLYGWDELVGLYLDFLGVNDPEIRAEIEADVLARSGDNYDKFVNELSLLAARLKSEEAVQAIDAETRSEARRNPADFDVAAVVKSVERKTFEGPREHTLPNRLLGSFKNADLSRALEFLGIRTPTAFADSASREAIQLGNEDQKILQLLQEVVQTPREGTPRALFDYRETISAEPQDFDTSVLLAAADKNLALTLWLKGTEAEINHVRSTVRKYAVDHYGAYPENLKIAQAPANVIGALTAEAKKAKVPVGFVSSNLNLLPKFNTFKGVLLARGSATNVPLQNLTAMLLSRQLLAFDSNQLDTTVYTGESLAQGRFAELQTALAARAKLLAAA